MDHFSKTLPVQSHPEKENHWIFDNGKIESLFEVLPDESAHIHFFVVKDNSLFGKRTGIGRAVVAQFREVFNRITAVDVGGNCEGGIAQHPAFRFWRKMLEERLIDEILIYDDNNFDGLGIDLEMLQAGPIETGFGTIYPDAERREDVTFTM